MYDYLEYLYPSSAPNKLKSLMGYTGSIHEFKSLGFYYDKHFGQTYKLTLSSIGHGHMANLVNYTCRRLEGELDKLLNVEDFN